MISSHLCLAHGPVLQLGFLQNGRAGLRSHRGLLVSMERHDVIPGTTNRQRSDGYEHKNLFEKSTPMTTS